jgi:DNA polymerase V
VRARMTVVGLRTVKELRGEACIPLEITPPNKKLITVSRSFGAATSSFDELRGAVAFYVTRAAEKLRRQKLRRQKLRLQKLAAGTITVFIETDRFRPGCAQIRKECHLDCGNSARLAENRYAALHFITAVENCGACVCSSVFRRFATRAA